MAIVTAAVYPPYGCLLDLFALVRLITFLVMKGGVMLKRRKAESTKQEEESKYESKDTEKNFCIKILSTPNISFFFYSSPNFIYHSKVFRIINT